MAPDRARVVRPGRPSSRAAAGSGRRRRRKRSGAWRALCRTAPRPVNGRQGRRAPSVAAEGATGPKRVRTGRSLSRRFPRARCRHGHVVRGAARPRRPSRDGCRAAHRACAVGRGGPRPGRPAPRPRCRSPPGPRREPRRADPRAPRGSDRGRQEQPVQRAGRSGRESVGRPPTDHADRPRAGPPQRPGRAVGGRAGGRRNGPDRRPRRSDTGQRPRSRRCPGCRLDRSRQPGPRRPARRGGRSLPLRHDRDALRRPRALGRARPRPRTRPAGDDRGESPAARCRGSDDRPG